MVGRRECSKCTSRKALRSVCGRCSGTSGTRRQRRLTKVGAERGSTAAASAGEAADRCRRGSRRCRSQSGATPTSSSRLRERNAAAPTLLTLENPLVIKRRNPPPSSWFAAVEARKCRVARRLHRREVGRRSTSHGRFERPAAVDSRKIQDRSRQGFTGFYRYRLIRHPLLRGRSR